MWLSKIPHIFAIFAGSKSRKWAFAPVATAGLVFLQACTLQPLNSTSSAIGSGSDGLAPSTAEVLSGMEVAKVNSRVGQQVRNALLFKLNGGKQREGGNYKVNLAITALARNLSIETNELAPTSARLEMTGTYTLIDKRNGSTIGSGTRKTIAAYDLTPQSFANERALRDAENRGAKALAEQLRLAIAQEVAGI